NVGPAFPMWNEAVMRGLSAEPFGSMDTIARLFNRPPATMPDARDWLALPAFGPMREHQERYGKLALAWIDYQDKLRRYNDLMMQAARLGFERFEGKLAEREQPGRQIDSLRALYDLWVDAA